MAGVVILVINDCCPGRVIDDIPTVLAVGDIRKLVTETIQCLGSCSKTQSVRRHNRQLLAGTLNKSAREVSMLRTGMFLESEGAGELE